MESDAANGARVELEKIAARPAGDRVGTQVSVAAGNPAAEIIRVAERDGCDLVGISTHGRRGLERAFLGSVTDKVIHASHLPTLTIAPERARDYWRKSMKMSKSLVPLDGSPLSETVTPYVEDLARRLSLEIELVRVTRGGISTPYSAALLQSEGVNLDEEIEEESREYLEGIAERMKSLDVRRTVLKGRSAFTIVDRARETPQDVIVLTSRGRSGLARWAVGSVAEAVIRFSGDPILVIPSPNPVPSPRPCSCLSLPVYCRRPSWRGQGCVG